MPMTFATGASNDALARGEQAFVNCEDSVLATVVPSLPYTQIQNVSSKCLPLHYVEAVYARVLVPEADCLDHIVGPSSVDIDKLPKRSDLGVKP